MNELIQEIIDDLTTELKITDNNFNSDLLTSKVNSATREVRRERRYPKTYSEEMIVDDMKNYFDVIRNIAMYDYFTVGDEFQTNSSENSVTRSWVDRKSLFAGVIPLAKF